MFFLYHYDRLLWALYLPWKTRIAARPSDEICDLKKPRNVKEPASFIDPCNAFCQFILSFSCIANPFKKMLRKNQPQSFDDLTNEERDVLQIVQKCLISTPIAMLPSSKMLIHRPYCCLRQTVRCNVTSRTAAGAVKNNLILVKIALKSQKFAEYDWERMSRLCMGTAALAHVPGGSWYTFCTDHYTLNRILNLSDVTGKLARWQLQLSAYEVDVVHRPAAKNEPADALLEPKTDGAGKAQWMTISPCC